MRMKNKVLRGGLDWKLLMQVLFANSYVIRHEPALCNTVLKKRLRPPNQLCGFKASLVTTF